MTFKSGLVSEDWRSALIVPLARVKERTKCKNYRGKSVLSAVGKIYAGILVGSL